MAPLSSLSLFLFLSCSHSQAAACTAADRTDGHMRLRQCFLITSIYLFSLSVSQQFHFTPRLTFCNCSNTWKPDQINSRTAETEMMDAMPACFHKAAILFPTTTNSDLIRALKCLFSLEKEGGRLHCLQTQRAKLRSPPELRGSFSLDINSPCFLLSTCRGVADLQNLLWVGVGSNWRWCVQQSPEQASLVFLNMAAMLETSPCTLLFANKGVCQK